VRNALAIGLKPVTEGCGTFTGEFKVKSLKYASALLALVFASQAQATRYAWCDVQVGKEGDLFLYHQTGIIEIAEEPDADFNLKYGPFGQGFKAYMNAVHVDCDSTDTLKEAQRQQDFEITGGIYKKTGWLGGRPAAVDRNDPKPVDKDALILTRPGQKVTVDTRARTDSAPAKKQWEIDYDHKMAKYHAELARQQAAYRLQQAEFDANRAENAERARKAKAEWERAVAACKGGDRMACAGASEQ
jgi:hypothetical protein